MYIKSVNLFCVSCVTFIYVCFLISVCPEAKELKENMPCNRSNSEDILPENCHMLHMASEVIQNQSNFKISDEDSYDSNEEEMPYYDDYEEKHLKQDTSDEDFEDIPIRKTPLVAQPKPASYMRVRSHYTNTPEELYHKPIQSKSLSHVDNFPLKETISKSLRHMLTTPTFPSHDKLPSYDTFPAYGELPRYRSDSYDDFSSQNKPRGTILHRYPFQQTTPIEQEAYYEHPHQNKPINMVPDEQTPFHHFDIDDRTSLNQMNNESTLNIGNIQLQNAQIKLSPVLLQALPVRPANETEDDYNDSHLIDIK